MSIAIALRDAAIIIWIPQCGFKHEGRCWRAHPFEDDAAADQWMKDFPELTRVAVVTRGKVVAIFGPEAQP
jgi:hypothetical protein